MQYFRNLTIATRIDVIGLLLAGLINTFLALGDVGIILAPGTPSLQSDLEARIVWIADNTLQWQAGWLFWFAVTLSFSWSYFALGRNLQSKGSWVQLAVGLAVIAAAVDIVGILVNMVILPPLAEASSAAMDEVSLSVMFQSFESFANALTNVSAFGLYSLAGLLILPACFDTPDYPRNIARLGVAEWSIASIATILLVVAPSVATTPLMISFLLYAPWVWSSAWWLIRRSHRMDNAPAL